MAPFREGKVVKNSEEAEKSWNAGTKYIGCPELAIVCCQAAQPSETLAVPNV